MGVTITRKKKTETQEAVATQSVATQEVEVQTETKELVLPPEVIEAANRIAGIREQLKAVNAYALLDQYDKEKAALAKMVAALPTKEAVTIPTSNGGAIKFTAPKVSRSLMDDEQTLAKLKAMLGEEVFAALAKVSLKDAEKYLTPLQLEELVETNLGSRSFKDAT